MLDGLISAYGDRFLVAALGVSLALLCLFIVLWLLRNRAPSPFVRGGRNRQPRLQVLDAAAVDTRRRIVLIRRDNVEHLVMIGGPTDIVIESGIGDDRTYLNARPLQPIAASEEGTTLADKAATGLLPQQPSATMPDMPAPVLAAPAPAAPVQAGNALPASQPVRTIDAPTRPDIPTLAPARPVADAANRPVETPKPAAQAGTVVAPAAAAAFAPGTAVRAAQPEARNIEPTAPVQLVATPRTETIRAQEAPDQPFRKPDASERHAETRPETLDAAVARQPERAPQPRMEPAILAEQAGLEPNLSTKQEEAGAAEEPPMSTAPAMAAPEPAATAEDILDAARIRVLSAAPAEPPVVRPFEADRFQATRPELPMQLQAENIPQRDLSDFERVLEEEMALHLAAEPAPLPQASNRPIERTPFLTDTRTDRPRPPMSAILPDGRLPAATDPAFGDTKSNTEEPNLQNEIARIFGEMSASRSS